MRPDRLHAPLHQILIDRLCLIVLPGRRQGARQPEQCLRIAGALHVQQLVEPDGLVMIAARRGRCSLPQPLLPGSAVARRRRCGGSREMRQHERGQNKERGGSTRASGPVRIHTWESQVQHKEATV